MIRQPEIVGNPLQTLRKFALAYPEAEEGISCDNAAFKARSKAFLFTGSDDKSYHALLKLGESLAEANKLAAKQPHHFKVGGTDWVTATFGHDQAPPEGLLERWIDESYRLLAPKQLVAKLRPTGQPAEVVASEPKAILTPPPKPTEPKKHAEPKPPAPRKVPAPPKAPARVKHAAPAKKIASKSAPRKNVVRLKKTAKKKARPR